MTPDEHRLLSDLLDRLARLPAGYKDPEADALINAAMIKLPDAPYQLVQAYILHEQAAAQAKSRIAQLEADVARLRQELQSRPQAQSYAPPPPAPPAPSPWGAPAAPSPWGAPAARPQSFLGSVAETAAGVAGGMLLAEGLSNLFGGHRGGWGGWGGGPTRVENTTIVNETVNESFYARDDRGGYDAGGYDSGGSDSGDFDDI